jgi:hypothetical protein
LRARRVTTSVVAEADAKYSRSPSGPEPDVKLPVPLTAERLPLPTDAGSCANRRSGSTRTDPSTVIATSPKTLKIDPFSAVTAYVTAGTKLLRRTAASIAIELCNTRHASIGMAKECRTAALLPATPVTVGSAVSRTDPEPALIASEKRSTNVLQAALAISVEPLAGLPVRF